MKFSCFIFIIGLFSLISCAPVSQLSKLQAPVVTTTEPDRIRFSGKGAGAGMMMASTMGPMGIAIGVAIDEGISKDIQQTAGDSFDIKLLVADALLQQGCSVQACSLSQINIERYGFISQPGDNDPVAAELHISALWQGELVNVRYPQDFTKSEIVIKPLDEIKMSSASIKSLLTDTSLVVSQRMLNQR